MVSARPIVSGDGPREDPTPTPAVRNSKLATLSARDIVAGDILPRGDGPSPRRDGGLGITIDPVGVEDADCLGGKAGVISPTSENKSPSKKMRKYKFIFQLNIYTSITVSRKRMSAFHKTTTNKVRQRIPTSNEGR
ncbi:hypothetical protein ALC62_10035 [Cyphomyrmex costatus]|uniref:Uncharacterized protein n=1 Tax=Cyphomyrmex costatus TaxID=456900 RepID=A0A151IEH3_9HYME|nr:hypothetical protein ALC62_10035 [Cyphomyrmex costatus]